MREINAYRLFHKVSPLTQDFNLTKIAQARALKLASVKKLSPDSNKDYEEIVGSVRLFTDPLLIKSWNDSMFRYKLRFPSLTKKISKFYNDLEKYNSFRN